MGVFSQEELHIWNYYIVLIIKNAWKFNLNLENRRYFLEIFNSSQWVTHHCMVQDLILLKTFICLWYERNIFSRCSEANAWNNVSSLVDNKQRMYWHSSKIDFLGNSCHQPDSCKQIITNLLIDSLKYVCLVCMLINLWE